MKPVPPVTNALGIFKLHLVRIYPSNDLFKKVELLQICGWFCKGSFVDEECERIADLWFGCLTTLDANGW